MICAAVFLGNCGRQYENNRHNAAWLFADSLPFAGQLDWQKKFRGQFSSVSSSVLLPYLSSAAESAGLPAENGQDMSSRLYFLKPDTFMNLSGESLGEMARFFRIEPEELLVIHDELELPPGTVSLKWSGGLGGHNGLRSAKSALGTADFWRLRIGIGRPAHSDVAGYVLSDFTNDERIILSQVFQPLGGLFSAVLMDDPRRLLPAWSKKKLVQ